MNLEEFKNRFFILTKMSGLNEAINTPPAKHYKRVEEKPYNKWLNEHKEEILNQPVKVKVEYAFEKINKDLKLDLKFNVVYQLLYRNGLLGQDVYKNNPDYYFKQLMKQLKEMNSPKQTKKYMDKLMDLYVRQGPIPKQTRRTQNKDE